jgi:daunorubicin resistance ABC transporter ATP-binding subunit
VPTHDNAVETDRLTKRFGDFTAVDGISFTVPAGSVVALLGPNGAGKTTTVRMLATLLHPTSGTARVGGHDVVREGDAVRSLMSLTGQFAALEDNLTARENLVLMARLRGYAAAAANHVAAGLIDRFDIGEFRDQLIKSVSGGQRRRVDLAASLVVQPEVLVLDEPTSGLDPRSRQVVWATARELVTEGVTLLLTTQYLEEADELAENIVLIDHGRAVATGTPAQLKARIGEQRVDITAPDTSALDALAASLRDRFDVTVTRERRTLSIPAPREALDLADVAEAVARSGVPVDEVALRRPTLDDAFLALTGHRADVEQESSDAIGDDRDDVSMEARV